jgi:hypothetical protein
MAGLGGAAENCMDTRERHGARFLGLLAWARSSFCYNMLRFATKNRDWLARR